MRERVVIVGPGRMGLAMGTALIRSGALESLTYFGRSLEPPPHPLFEPENGAEYRQGPLPVPPGTTAILLAVPDDDLASVAEDLARAGDAPPGCSALHLSGALSAEALGALHAVGFSVGSIHPFQSIADPWTSADRLLGASYAVAGEPAAIAAGRRLASSLGGNVVVVPPGLRPLYHAAGVLASNYLTTLAASAVRLLTQSGFGEAEAVEAVASLSRGTVDNLETLGLAQALTGPIARGDVETVRLHLGRLSPEDRDLYCALGRETLRLARAAGLGEEPARRLGELLRDSR